MRTLTAVGFLLALIAVAQAGSAVIATVYWPGDKIVPKWDYRTSSGQRYDAKAFRVACLDYPLGTRLYLQRGRNAAEVVCNDHGTCGDGAPCTRPFKGRRLDVTPAVDNALHLEGLGRVSVQFWPPLPRERPKEAPQ